MVRSSRIPLIFLRLVIAFHLGHGVEQFDGKGIHDARSYHLCFFQASAQVGERAHSVSTRCHSHVELLDDRKEDRIEGSEARCLLLLLKLLLALILVSCVCRAVVTVRIWARGVVGLAQLKLLHPSALFLDAIRVAAVVVCIVRVG